MFAFLKPSQQITFSVALAQARGLFLQEALGNTVERLDIAILDKELAQMAPKKVLAILDRHGLCGELVFAVPCLLKAAPRLLAYYRLLLGYSQKEFFNKATGASAYKAMESEGRLPQRADGEIAELCRALNLAAVGLVEGVGLDRISKSLLDDLTLLTLGPQLRGGANVRKGGDATLKVFEIIHDHGSRASLAIYGEVSETKRRSGPVRARSDRWRGSPTLQGGVTHIVKKAVQSSGANRIEVRNAARRTVMIEFAADPDLIIREQMSKGRYRNIIAIEIKGGTDFSNIHNRLGEAEKSHQKARSNGFTECWTVVNVSQLDSAQAHQESPSTDRFYQLSRLADTRSDEYQDFRERIISLIGIRG